MQGLSKGVMRKKQGKRVADQIEESAWQFAMARIMQLVGIPAILMVAGFVWSGVATLATSVAEMKTSVKVLETKLTEQENDRYRASTAKSEFDLRDSRIADNTRRIQALEEQLRRERDERRHDDALRGTQ